MIPIILTEDLLVTGNLPILTNRLVKNWDKIKLFFADIAAEANGFGSRIYHLDVS
jgi:hypothetical protein